MAYTHVFATHAMLQEQLAEAIIRERNIPVEEVLVIRSRGSYRSDERKPYRVLDGGRYRTTGGNNVFKHLRANRSAHHRFQTEVLEVLAPTFEVYSAMYTYWYLHALRRRAAAYHILEDGFGSYQTLTEHETFFAEGAARSAKNRLLVLRRRLAQLPEQRPDGVEFTELLEKATHYYTTSAACFPWAPAEKKVVLQQPFLPRYVGEYEGAVVLATSCFVETGNISLPDYLGLLRRVGERLVAAGCTEVYYKLHPAQAVAGGHGAAYRGVLAEFSDRIVFRKLPQGTSIESLAAGNRITLVTGVSTLAFHVQATGATVLTYLDEIEKIGPEATSYLAKGGMKIFRQITRPL